jgi:hypothetical protein
MYGAPSGKVLGRKGVWDLDFWEPLKSGMDTKKIL